jgi:hypothetical protein
MISPKGSVTCYYYENTIDPNKILPILPEGHGYVYPEFSAVNAISNELSKYLVPVNEEELKLKLTKTSLPRDYFYQLHNQRFGPITNVQFSNVRHICSCGKNTNQKLGTKNTQLSVRFMIQRQPELQRTQ